MIGGYDAHFPCSVNYDDITFTLDFVKNAWPDVVKKFLRGSIKAFTKRNGVSPGAEVEIILYRDEDAAASWGSEGLTEENSSKMIVVTFEKDAICFIMDKESSASGNLVKDLLESLKANRHVWS